MSKFEQELNELIKLRQDLKQFKAGKSYLLNRLTQRIYYLKNIKGVL